MNKKFHEIVSNLYDPDHIGVMSIRCILDTSDLQQIRNVFDMSAKHFYPLKSGNVTRWDLLESDFHKYPLLELCRKKFRKIINKISTELEINSIYKEKFCVMFYPEGSAGIKPHRDSIHSVNCVVIFIISGNSTFFAVKDMEGKNVIGFPARAGDAILMRGPRNINDTLSRPIHYVNKVPEPRYVMICRHVDLDNLKPQIL